VAVCNLINGAKQIHEFWAFLDPGPLQHVPPEPLGPRFSCHSGYISGGGDLFQEWATVDEAKRKCQSLPSCCGFTFQGDGTHGRRMLIFYKNKWDLFGDEAWTSYRCYRKGEIDPNAAAAAAASEERPAEYASALAAICLPQASLNNCAVLQRIEALTTGWGGAKTLGLNDISDLVRAAGKRGFVDVGLGSKAGTRSNGQFFVMWHIDYGNVQGAAFQERSCAEARFSELNGGAFAALLTDEHFQELQYYGARGTRLADFWSWWSQQQHAPDLFVDLLHDEKSPRVGLVAQVTKLTRTEAKGMLQDWRVALLPALLSFLSSEADPGDVAAVLLLLAFCSWRLFDSMICPVIARRTFDRALLLLNLPSGTVEQGPSAQDFPSCCAAFRKWVNNYLDAHKEKALASAFIEPSKLYWRRVHGEASVAEHDVDAHAANAYAGLVERVLGIRCPLPVSWDDINSVHGSVDFLQAGFLFGALRAMERIENFGQAFGKIIRQRGEEDGRAMAVPLAGVRFIFAGARSPEELVLCALCPGDDISHEREALKPYLERFARFFRLEFFLEAACSAALADDISGGSKIFAKVLRLLCSEDSAFTQKRCKGSGDLPEDDVALCRTFLWDFDDACFPTFDVLSAQRLFSFVGGLLRSDCAWAVAANDSNFGG